MARPPLDHLSRIVLVSIGLVAGLAAPVANAAGDPIPVACNDTGNVQDAIDSAPSGATLLVSGECVGTFVIDKDLVIEGPATLNGDGSGPVVRIPGDASVNGHRVTLRDLTITGGAADFGGGIANWGGHLVLERVWVIGNAARDSGGGIASVHDGMGGSLTLLDTWVNDNTAGIAGGAVWIQGSWEGAGSWSGGGARHNSAADGGALRIQGIPITLTGVWLANNLAGSVEVPGRGGAISATHGVAVTIEASSLTRNQAFGSGGAIFSEAALLIDTSTIAANTGVRGGGIYSNGSASIAWSTISGNHGWAGGGIWVQQPANVIRTSILGGNTAEREASDCWTGPSPLVSRGGNVFGGEPPCWVYVESGVDVVSIPPYTWLELGEHGGAGESMALSPEAPAIDMVFDGCVLSSDQRGSARPSGYTCDAGAFEGDRGPSTGFEAMPELDAIGLNYYPPFTAVVASIFRAGEPVWAGNGLVGEDGFGWIGLAPFDLMVDDRVVVLDVNRSRMRETTVVPLTFDVFDLAADRISGTARPGSEVVVFVESEAGLVRQYRLSTGADGKWATAADFDILPEHFASVRIVDIDGDTTLVHQPSSVTVTAPMLGPVVVTSEILPVGGSGEIEVSLFDPDPGDTHEAVIEWGDGTTSAGTVSGSPQSGEGVVTGAHQYDEPGVYDLVVTVTDRSGLVATAEYGSLAVVALGGGGLHASGAIPGTRPPTVVSINLTTARAGIVGSVALHGSQRFRSDAISALVSTGSQGWALGTGTYQDVPGYGFWVHVMGTAPGTAIEVRLFAPGADPHRDLPEVVIAGQLGRGKSS